MRTKIYLINDECINTDQYYEDVINDIHSNSDLFIRVLKENKQFNYLKTLDPRNTNEPSTITEYRSMAIMKSAIVLIEKID